MTEDLSPLAPRRAHGRAIGPGLALAVLVAGMATPLGAAIPTIGAPVLGIVLGSLLNAAIKPGNNMRPGLRFASGPILQTSVVVIGATLSLHEVTRVGIESLPVMLGTLSIALLGAWLIGRMLRVPTDVAILIGVGTAICGASAIAAVSAVIRPRRSHVAYAIGTIFTFNIVAVLLFPALGHAWGLTPHSFGLWAGTAINDTSSVAAAGFAYSPDAGPYAVVVKLCRTVMLIPIALGLGIWRSRRTSANPVSTDRPNTRMPWRALVPRFLIGFLLTSAAATVGLVPAAWDGGLVRISTFLITTALAAIGLSLPPAELRNAGVRPLLMGAVLWVLVASSSLGLQALTHTL